MERIAIAMQDGGAGAAAQHGGAGARGQPHFCLATERLCGAPGRGDCLVSNFHRGPGDACRHLPTGMKNIARPIPRSSSRAPAILKGRRGATGVPDGRGRHSPADVPGILRQIAELRPKPQPAPASDRRRSCVQKHPTRGLRPDAKQNQTFRPQETALGSDCRRPDTNTDGPSEKSGKSLSSAPSSGFIRGIPAKVGRLISHGQRRSAMDPGSLLALTGASSLARAFVQSLAEQFSSNEPLTSTGKQPD
jgi:hypothetical protein